MKDDCIRPRLVKCQSLLLNYWQVDPENFVMMHLPFGLVKYRSWLSHVVICLPRLLHRVHGCEEHRPSSLSCIFFSCNQMRLDDGVQIEQPTSWMYSTKFIGSITLSCSVGSTFCFRNDLEWQANTTSFHQNSRNIVTVVYYCLVPIVQSNHWCPL